MSRAEQIDAAWQALAEEKEAAALDALITIALARLGLVGAR